MASKKIVVVGGVAGGMSTAAKAKRTDKELQVTVFERSGHVSYGACGLPYVVGGDVKRLDDLVSRTPEEMAEQGVTVRVRHEVTGVDPEARTVSVTDLTTGETFAEPYDALVLATGASATKPDLPGADLENVHVLRTLEDGAAVQKTLAAGVREALIIGGSYIGLELAEAFVKAGLTVRVVEQAPMLLPSFGPSAAETALEVLQENGVAVELDTEVTALEGTGRVQSVVTSAGRFPADLVMFAVGAKPNSELAEALGLELGPSGAVVTDERLRTSREGVYAVGDVSAARHILTGEPVWIPLGDTANKQGRVLGKLLGGGEDRFKGIAGTAVTKVFDRAFATTGLTLGGAKDAGFDADSKEVTATDHAGYYPDSRELRITLVWEKASRRLLGAQLVGHGDAVKRVDVVSALLFQGGTLQDLADLDLAYAPPFSSAWDPLLVAANVALGR